jgi:response regulator RpfG family c-di-GMP phosphodiesterase
MDKGIIQEQTKVLKELNILFVEDSVEISESMKELFSKICKNFYTALNGKDGLEFFIQNQHRIDIVITDINMPQMDGITMAKEIKKIRKVPIIVSTAFSETQFLIDAFNIGISKYVLKPINVYQMMEVIYETIIPIIQSQEIAKINNNLEKKISEKIEEFKGVYIELESLKEDVKDFLKEYKNDKDSDVVSDKIEYLEKLLS